MDDPILTTGEAALLLGVSIRTVQTWIEQDVIDSWKTPGGHRRVRRSAVLALRERLIARNDEAVIPLLVLTDGESGLQPMELLRLVPNARITTCGDTLSFLIEAGHQKPDVLIIEIAHSDWGRLAMLRRILQSRPLAHARIVLITTMHFEQIKIDVGDHPRMQVLPLLTVRNNYWRRYRCRRNDKKQDCSRTLFLLMRRAVCAHWKSLTS